MPVAVNTNKKLRKIGPRTPNSMPQSFLVVNGALMAGAPHERPQPAVNPQPSTKSACWQGPPRTHRATRALVARGARRDLPGASHAHRWRCAGERYGAGAREAHAGVGTRGPGCEPLAGTHRLGHSGQRE